MENLFEDMEQHPGTYQTKDFYIASYLKAKGFKLTGSEKRGKQVYFAFKDEKAAHEAVKKLFRGNETIIALDFIASIKNIKAIIHNI